MIYKIFFLVFPKLVSYIAKVGNIIEISLFLGCLFIFLCPEPIIVPEKWEALEWVEKKTKIRSIS